MNEKKTQNLTKRDKNILKCGRKYQLYEFKTALEVGEHIFIVQMYILESHI